MPCVRDLSQDSSQHVRAALASQISGLAPLLGNESTVKDLLPLFLHLLKDDFPEVRLNIISKLETVNNGMIITYMMTSSNTHTQSLASSFSLTVSYLLLWNWLRTRVGVFDRPSSNIYLF